MEDFEEQIRLEEEDRRRRDGTSDKIRVDPDGIVMEFDEDKKAWFPKVNSHYFITNTIIICTVN